MLESRRRLIVVTAVTMVAVPLIVAATAFACARLATLKLDRKSGKAGTEVTATGRNFNSTQNSSAISLRFNSRNGQVLWTGRPDELGRFQTSFTLPKARKGHYVILATQVMQNGAPAPGTPGRAPIRMKRTKKAKQSKKAAAPVAVAPLPGGPGGSPGPGLLPIGGGALALLLAGGGLALGARRRGTATLTRVS